ncbi:sulfotransferase family protein [Nannochloropsis gaditana]|uniref:Sulfotransferase family protein n=2 Tax=Nannochloropsis gaditana TaxID=72520 RepID=W7TT65_9STRA|nr:sulfotransferase family protein [Nannochloropsis gaditana]
MPYEATTDLNENSAIVRMKACLSKFETEEGRLKGFAFKPSPTDILVVTSPKAGTTWMQQICHQLRTCGDMNFSEISEVVPWVELAHDLGQDLNADQGGLSPRLFKSHAWKPHVPKGGRYIVCFRDPEDVVYSFYRFFDGWFIQPKGAVSFEVFAREFFLHRDYPTSPMQNASYWHHLVSWMENIVKKGGGQEDEDVLLVAFEDLKGDLERQVRRVATFMGYTGGEFEERVRVATEHSSLAFMQRHRDKFDEHLTKEARNEAMGLPRDAGRENAKVKEGGVGAAAVAMSPALREAMQRRWQEVASESLGFGDYSELLVWHRQQQVGLNGSEP